MGSMSRAQYQQIKHIQKCGTYWHNICWSKAHQHMYPHLLGRRSANSHISPHIFHISPPRLEQTEEQQRSRTAGQAPHIYSPARAARPRSIQQTAAVLSPALFSIYWRRGTLFVNWLRGMRDFTLKGMGPHFLHMFPLCSHTCTGSDVDPHLFLPLLGTPPTSRNNTCGSPRPHFMICLQQSHISTSGSYLARCVPHTQPRTGFRPGLLMRYSTRARGRRGDGRDGGTLRACSRLALACVVM
jgi:hypothetical protein